MERYLSGPQLARLIEIPAGTRPYYRALAGSVRTLVLDGRLPTRVRMPAERHLADALGVSRTTVTAAYDRLREQGYLESRKGAGSWTALPAPGALGTENPWTSADGDDGLLPLHSAAPPATVLLPEALAGAAEDYPRYGLGTGYDPMGILPLREAIAGRYVARGLPTRPDQILVTLGAQHGTHLLMSLLAGPGDPVLVESPTYPHALDAARGRGARLVPVGVQENGPPMDLVRSALRQSGARLAYVIPDFQNPTGVLMPDAARAALTEAARRHDTTLIVDESWTEMATDEAPATSPLAAFDTDGRVISVGSSSKLMWGGLRIGWIRATAALVRRLAVVRASVDLAAPLFEQLVVTRLLARIEEVRAERRSTITASRAALVESLRERIPEWRFTLPRGGASLWVRLDAPVATPLADAAAACGVRLAPGPWFGVDGTLERYLRLPYTMSPAALTEAVRRLAVARTLGPGAVHGRPAAPLTPTL
ncbi:GntR family transcriptional regulator [Sphaerisporangium krabiense]|uniref:DNA-binding transcriptional MocR family regulator n=1 Tax=Sphaerisporangium krabiense TaxID=763782 RepID=A0A7W8ZCC8_9ACTN|nr:PLP-dependent aminotransferase family protein [Sphaerisporangium krabiense]MBB5631078.1 DNA-binding transcriptional MocR family regulator [Sphaerisporangium krabiense]GII65962.1 GntR family transcriptional regulator [Sphaerisporangium krabiense]